jgi:hypothetical protein
LTFLRLFGLLVLLKAVDLIVRLEPAGILGFALGAVWAAAGAALSIGVARRTACATLVVLVAAITAVPELHNQHLWLIGWIAAGLAVLDAAPLRWFLRAQVTIVYGFAALAKLTPWWLDGSVLAATAGQRWAVPMPVWALIAWLTVATEGWLAVGLWFERTRRASVLLGACLHVGIVLAMSTGATSLVRMLVFNGLMVVLYLPFLRWRDDPYSAITGGPGSADELEAHAPRP